jgi:hypothetical protein
VPIFPALNVLAAAGLVWGAARLAQARRWAVRRAQALCVGVVALLAVANVAWWHPYSIAAFNQVLGGADAGAYAFAIGWGEGLGQAGHWLNQQPNITGVRVVGEVSHSLQPYLRHGAYVMPPPGGTLPPDTGYVLVYVRDVQRDKVWPPFDRFYPEQVPVHTVSIHGVEYIWIYEVPPPMAHETSARFGEHIHLHGYEIDSTALRSTGALSLTLQWQTDAPLSEDYMLFAHLLDDDGQRVAQTDAPPGGDMPTSAWEPRRSVTWVHPLLVPPDLPPGDYWLALGLYHPSTLERLPLRAAVPPDAPDAGPHALLLPVTIE